MKYIAYIGSWNHFVFVFVIVIFVSFRLGQCHHQKIYDLYGLEHYTVEINLDVTMETTNKRTSEVLLSQWTL